MRRLWSMGWSALVALAMSGPVQAEERAPIAYVGAVATTVFYLPVKVVYAGLGGTVGGLSLLVTGGNPDAFFAVWDAAGGGTYVVTPAMLEGDEEVRFVGP